MIKSNVIPLFVTNFPSNAISCRYSSDVTTHLPIDLSLALVINHITHHLAFTNWNKSAHFTHARIQAHKHTRRHKQIKSNQTKQGKRFVHMDNLRGWDTNFPKAPSTERTHSCQN